MWRPSIPRSASRLPHGEGRASGGHHFRDGLSAWSLWSRAIVGWGLTKFQGTKIGRLPGKTIGHVGQGHAMINSCRTRLEPEIEIFCLVNPLHLLEISRVEIWDVHKHVIADGDTVKVLMCDFAVFGERQEPTRFQSRVACRTTAANGGD